MSLDLYDTHHGETAAKTVRKIAGHVDSNHPKPHLTDYEMLSLIRTFDEMRHRIGSLESLCESASRAINRDRKCRHCGKMT